MRYLALFLVPFVMVAAGCIPAPAPAPQTPATPKAPEPAAAADAPTERVVAEAGVGKKGQSLENESGIVVEPVKQLIRFEQKAVFDLQIKPALELYKATNGAYPQTDEEFMQKVIKENGITLPELPAGQRYVYDPNQAQLMVERPQQ